MRDATFYFFFLSFFFSFLLPSHRIGIFREVYILRLGGLGVRERERERESTVYYIRYICLPTNTLTHPSHISYKPRIVILLFHDSLRACHKGKTSTRSKIFPTSKPNHGCAGQAPTGKRPDP